MSQQHMAASEEALPARGCDPKLIKRYVNRKFYDTVDSRYVTLDEIAEMIRAGAEVKIVDNTSMTDITRVTLVHIIYEKEKQATGNMSLRMLCEVIRGAPQPPLEAMQTDPRYAVEVGRQAAEHRVRLLLDRGQHGNERAKELVATSREAVAQLQRKMAERVGAAFEVVGAIGKVKRELSRLAGQIDDLDERLRELGEPPPETACEARGARELLLCRAP